MRRKLWLGTLVLMALLLVPLPFTYEAPGPIYTARRLLEFDEHQPGWSERLLVPTVRRRSATPVLALGALLRPEATLARAAGPGQTALAFEYARLAARRATGRSAQARYTGPEGLGPSSSLMLSLAMAMETQETAPRLEGKIAGSGVLDPEGSVHPVQGLATKVRAAEAAGAIVFLYPAAQTVPSDVDLVTVPVATVKTALDTLVRPGEPALQPPAIEIVPGMGR